MRITTLHGFLGTLLAVAVLAACGGAGQQILQGFTAAEEARVAALEAQLAALTFADIGGEATDAQIPDDITINESTNADTVDGLHAADFLNKVTLTFESTVSAVFNQGGGQPAGIAEDDTVVFEVAILTRTATPAMPAGTGQTPSGSGIYVAAWTFPATPYTMTFSSGAVVTGQITRVELDNDGGLADGDVISFFDGTNDIFSATNFDGTWITNPTPPMDLADAFVGIDAPALFDLTFNYGFWGDWGTYHYDYTKPQNNTIVTKTP